MTSIHEILQARWLINTDIILSYVPALLSYIHGNKSAFDGILTPKADQPKPFVVKSANDIVTKWDLDRTDIPENSVAIIPFSGPIMAYDSFEIMRANNLIAANNNIVAVVYHWNSPGGMVYGTDLCSDSIYALQKPKVMFGQNQICSAALWDMASVNYRIMSSPLDVVGSIGVMVSIHDMTRLMRDKLGIDIFEIYASKSTDKNKFGRLIKDDKLTPEERFGPIVKHLDFVNEFFHAAVRDRAGIAADSPVFSGDIYHSEEAKSLGLINEINTLEYAVDYARTLAFRNRLPIF